MKAEFLPEDLDERLWEWAYFFRDYRARGKCASLEGCYQRHSDDLGEDVSQEVREVTKAPRPRDWVLRAISTHEAIQTLDRQYKWALTYAYCYPNLPKFVVLQCMRHYTGKRLSWARFLDVVDIGRMRVWTLTAKKVA